MNISLSSTTKGGGSSHSNAKKNLIGAGLNRRDDHDRNRTKNVFGDDDDDEIADHPQHGRGAVNRELAAEQVALRKRAAAAAQHHDPSVYDYDNVYETFQSSSSSSEQHRGGTAAEKNEEIGNKPSEPRKSRYVQDLLKAAEHRKRQHDVVYERKLAKEQEAEASGGGDGVNLLPEERFITKAYKLKLQERQLWQEQEDARAKEEEQNDVTKKTKTSSNETWVKFYGNLATMPSSSGGSSSHSTRGDGRHDATNNKHHQHHQNHPQEVDDHNNDKQTDKTNNHGDIQDTKNPSSDNIPTGQIASAHQTIVVEPTLEHHGDDDTNDVKIIDSEVEMTTTTTNESLMDGFERGTQHDDDSPFTQNNHIVNQSNIPMSTGLSTNVAMSHSTLATNNNNDNTNTNTDLRYKLREEKLAHARIRYFRRKGMV